MGFLTDGCELRGVGVIQIEQERGVGMVLCHKQRLEGRNIVG